MRQTLTGLKIRSLRKAAGLTQGELARRAGISASYLNLIEANKRAVAGLLVDRLAGGLGVERASLDGEAERRVVQALEEIAADPDLAGPASPGPAEELVGGSPGWARLVLELYRAYQDQRQAVLALADRLNRDPFLGESVHRILTNVTSIRSASEILQGGETLDPADRTRFRAIIGANSAALAATARSLAAFFDSANIRVRSATSTEHVDAFFVQTGNHFPELEALAPEALRSGDGELPTAAPEASAESRRFRAVRARARAVAGETVAAIVAGHPALATEEARALAASALRAYVAGAALMPYEPFLEAAERGRYDLDALCRRFEVSYEQAAHRLATLRRPGAEGVRFAFMRSDASGFVTKRLPLPGLALPRYGNACPLWPIHGAFQAAGVTARNFGEMPTGERFLFFARAIEKRPAPVGFPRHLMSVMLACTAEDAGRVVYGDGIDRAAAMVPVGTICRLCPRAACGHRQEAPLVA
jgi:predicted transcriptional regulator/transcriptional regulator with XRE-family HTH domain